MLLTPIEGIISDTNRSYLQSMAGCKVKFEFNNLETICCPKSELIM